MLLTSCVAVCALALATSARPSDSTEIPSLLSRDAQNASTEVTPTLNGTANEPGNCKILKFQVSGSGVHKDVQIPADTLPRLISFEAVNNFFAGLKDLIVGAKDTTVQGTYTLVGEYCEPTALGGNQTAGNGPASPSGENQTLSHGKNQTASNGPGRPLQILLHGSSYTKGYWNRGEWGSGPLEYSWTNHMNRNGYATLALDKLGNGQSSHPDPVREVQLPLQQETIHDLITKIKSGKTPIPKPSRLIFVAHSSGSILAASLAQTHPDDADALVLTGYPAGGANNKGGVPSYKYLPAALSDPRFAGLPYGYMAMNDEVNRTKAFYYAGHFDPALIHQDYLFRGSSALGEGFQLGSPTQPAYKGKILVVTGQKDPAVCGFTPPEECAHNDTVVKKVNEQFSGNTGFDFHMPLTGHCLNWHYGALDTYGVVVQKLGRLLGSGGDSMEKPRGENMTMS